jgi:hypothetical protein
MQKLATSTEVPTTLEGIKEKRVYNAYCDEFKRFLRHKNGEYTTCTDDSKIEAKKREEAKAREKGTIKQMFDRTQGQSLTLGAQDESEEEGTDTNYQEMTKRHFRHIIEKQPFKTKVARRGDVVKYFFNNPSLLKLHDFLPDNFILTVNEKESATPHHLSKKDFCQMIEEPRDQVLIEEINKFFEANPMPTSSASVQYYCLLTDTVVQKLRKEFQEFPKVPNIIVNEDEEFGGPVAEAPRTKLNVTKFIRNLHERDECYEFLNSFAIYILPLNRLLTLSQVLIELDILIKKTTDPTRYNNDWDQFLQSIMFYRMNPDQVSFADFIPLKTRDDDRNLIETHLLNTIRSIFESCADENNIANVHEVVDKLKNTPDMIKNMDNIIRYKARIGRALHNETLRQVLDRIMKQSDLFSDWNEFCQYFTKRGYPM